ncbi:CHAD domain-containing protein [Mucilaginibacter flavidus]|uniref:CHAD domain-containing protein n=1 Tax=Mucilaginibacter flavidus TaxID=2949309 RepID=UPI00209308E6|nr:CHAD domain-containing protein [Mucilaginibacter flavidus]MCO5946786.1 CHAD domain-containing protein [Mucilaginibacter flavidus]
MERSKIENILNKRFEKINTAFDSFRLHLMEDDIRLFRVKVKKLAACLRLINAEKNHEHALKVPQKISKLYKIAGVIRILQMQQKFVEKTLDRKLMVPPGTYLKIIADQILHHIELVNKQIKGTKQFKKEEEKLLQLLPKHLREKTIQQFIFTEGDRLEKLLAPVFPADQSFHEVRELLKNLLHLSAYLEMEFSALFPYASLDSYDHIDAFTIVLGRFHDLNAAIGHLHTECIKAEIDENEKIVLRNMESLWMKERAAVREEIFDHLQKIISSGRSMVPLDKWPVM